MKKFAFFILFCLSLASFCFAQQNSKQTLDRIGLWRSDLSCYGMELGQVIRTYGDRAVSLLQECCPNHKSACLDNYSSPDNKTLLYTAIETKSYEVANFLFRLSSNYARNVDAYGLTKDFVEENEYFKIIVAKEDPTSKTPLMLACYNGDLKAAQLLINYGASLLKKNYTKDGKTNKNAYQYAQISPYKNDVFIKYLESEYKKQLDLYGQNQQENKDFKDFPLENLSSLEQEKENNFL